MPYIEIEENLVQLKTYKPINSISNLKMVLLEFFEPKHSSSSIQTNPNKTKSYALVKSYSNYFKAVQKRWLKLTKNEGMKSAVKVAN